MMVFGEELNQSKRKIDPNPNPNPKSKGIGAHLTALVGSATVAGTPSSSMKCSGKGSRPQSLVVTQKPT
jgi:hypothetical protein